MKAKTEQTRKVVINDCWGGFGISTKARQEIAKRKGVDVSEVSAYLIERDDPDLVAVVEQLGRKASDPYAKLKVVEIPADVEFEILEYDGNETIHEKHRTWC